MSNSSYLKGPWTWPKRVRKGLSLILTDEEIDKFMEKARGCGSASGETIQVPTGRGEEVAIVLSTVHPDDGYYKHYGVVHKGCDAIVIYSIPCNKIA